MTRPKRRKSRRGGGEVNGVGFGVAQHHDRELDDYEVVAEEERHVRENKERRAEILARSKWLHPDTIEADISEIDFHTTEGKKTIGNHVFYDGVLREHRFGEKEKVTYGLTYDLEGEPSQWRVWFNDGVHAKLEMVIEEVDEQGRPTKISVKNKNIQGTWVVITPSYDGSADQFEPQEKIPSFLRDEALPAVKNHFAHDLTVCQTIGSTLIHERRKQKPDDYGKSATDAEPEPLVSEDEHRRIDFGCLQDVDFLLRENSQYLVDGAAQLQSIAACITDTEIVRHMAQEKVSVLTEASVLAVRNSRFQDSLRQTENEIHRVQFLFNKQYLRKRLSRKLEQAYQDLIQPPLKPEQQMYNAFHVLFDRELDSVRRFVGPAESASVSTPLMQEIIVLFRDDIKAFDGIITRGVSNPGVIMEKVKQLSLGVAKRINEAVLNKATPILLARARTNLSDCETYFGQYRNVLGSFGSLRAELISADQALDSRVPKLQLLPVKGISEIEEMKRVNPIEASSVPMPRSAEDTERLAKTPEIFFTMDKELPQALARCEELQNVFKVIKGDVRAQSIHLNPADVSSETLNLHFERLFGTVGERIQDIRILQQRSHQLRELFIQPPQNPQEELNRTTACREFLTLYASVLGWSASFENSQNQRSIENAIKLLPGIIVPSLGEIFKPLPITTIEHLRNTFAQHLNIQPELLQDNSTSSLEELEVARIERPSDERIRSSPDFWINLCKQNMREFVKLIHQLESIHNAFEHRDEVLIEMKRLPGMLVYLRKNRDKLHKIMDSAYRLSTSNAVLNRDQVSQLEAQVQNIISGVQELIGDDYSKMLEKIIPLTSSSAGFIDASPVAFTSEAEFLQQQLAIELSKYEERVRQVREEARKEAQTRAQGVEEREKKEKQTDANRLEEWINQQANNGVVRVESFETPRSREFANPKELFEEIHDKLELAVENLIKIGELCQFANSSALVKKGAEVVFLGEKKPLRRVLRDNKLPREVLQLRKALEETAQESTLFSKLAFSSENQSEIEPRIILFLKEYGEQTQRYNNLVSSEEHRNTIFLPILAQLRHPKKFPEHIFHVLPFVSVEIVQSQVGRWLARPVEVSEPVVVTSANAQVNPMTHASAFGEAPLPGPGGSFSMDHIKIENVDLGDPNALLSVSVPEEGNVSLEEILDSNPEFVQFCAAVPQHAFEDGDFGASTPESIARLIKHVIPVFVLSTDSGLEAARSRVYLALREYLQMHPIASVESSEIRSPREAQDFWFDLVRANTAQLKRMKDHTERVILALSGLERAHIDLLGIDDRGLKLLKLLGVAGLKLQHLFESDSLNKPGGPFVREDIQRQYDEILGFDANHNLPEEYKQWFEDVLNLTKKEHVVFKDHKFNGKLDWKDFVISESWISVEDFEKKLLADRAKQSNSQ